MYHDPDYEYDEKSGRLVMELEMLVLDALLTVIERLRTQYQDIPKPDSRPDEKTVPF